MAMASEHDDVVAVSGGGGGRGCSGCGGHVAFPQPLDDHDHDENENDAGDCGDPVHVE